MEVDIAGELERRMVRYRVSRRKFWRNEFLPLSLLWFVITFGLSYWFCTNEGIRYLDFLFFPEIFAIGGLICLLTWHPHKPTLQEVENCKFAYEKFNSLAEKIAKREIEGQQ